MHVLYPDCAGLDVHQRTVVACCYHVAPDGTVRSTVRTFGTTGDQLEALGDWLLEEGVSIAAMESTGVYWQPVFNRLEDRLAVWLVNAAHVKNVPARQPKSDKRDSEWLAQLLSVGLLAPSFIPPKPQRELRAMTRQRTQFTADRARVANRIVKVLEAGGCKLASVASDPLGVSGQAVIEALIAGETDPQRLADRTAGRLRAAREQLVAALDGRLSPADRALLGDLLDTWRFLSAKIERLSARIAAATADQASRLAQLQEVPGVGRQTAEVILAEVGSDVAAFPSDHQLAAWAGLAPACRESAGKRQGSRTGGGNRWLKTALVQAGWAASRKRDSAVGAKFARWKRRRGGKRAAVATAHLLLRVVWHLLADPTSHYREDGAEAVRRADHEHLVRQLQRRLERLGVPPSDPPAEAAV